MSSLRRFREVVEAAKAAERARAAPGGNGRSSAVGRSGAIGRSGAASAGAEPGGVGDGDALAARPARPAAIPTGELERRRDEAARRFAEAHWDLGGLAYEMAVRDHFRLDVLQRQAAQVQELDAELSQLERLARLEESGAAGTCPNCHTPFGRGASFCSACGTQLVETVVAQ